MKTIEVPTRDQVSNDNQAIFDNLKKNLGFVPNLYATYAHSETALGDYLHLQNRKSTLKAKEREVINLIVSQINGCRYCQSAHTALGKMNGFTDEQIIEIRGGRASFDSKLDALAKFVQNITINRSNPDKEVVEALFNAGYDEANVIDIVMVIGDKTVSNFLNGVANIPIDFPVAPELQTANA